MTFKPRDYQIEISDRAAAVLRDRRIVALSAEVRTGKTFMALMSADKIGAKQVLFVTKKKAISSILADYETFRPDYGLTVINYESLHKLEDADLYDVVVVDESHSLGAFPKPSKRAKQLRQIVGGKYLIMLSGTISPESYSQLYHQFWISEHSPFRAHRNFYSWARTFVKIKDKYVSYGTVKDYSYADYDQIKPYIEPYMISFTQKEAGFSTKVREHIDMVPLPQTISTIIERLKRDEIVEGDEEVILGDTAVKKMQKVHQLCSGTIRFESGNSMIIDTFKADYIASKFEFNKIAIFYKFVAELDALKQVMGDRLTTDLDEFNQTDKNIALQIVSGREGISLKAADFLVYYNIDFSAVSYWQSRDRLTTMDRKENDIYWIFSDGGIEADIYEAVQKKKNYTLKHFERTSKTK